jgi:hypothetical protein
MSKRAALKIISGVALACLLCFLLGYTIQQRAVATETMGNVDFPCGIWYDDTRDCVRAAPWLEGYGRKRTAWIEVFLSSYSVGWVGMGCEYQSTSELARPIMTPKANLPALNLRFERETDSVWLNNRKLEKGENFQTVDLRDANPWIISRIELTNYGVVAECDDSAPTARGNPTPHPVLIGQYGTEVSDLKGAAIILVSVGGLLVLLWQLIKAVRALQRGRE